MSDNSILKNVATCGWISHQYLVLGKQSATPVALVSRTEVDILRILRSTFVPNGLHVLAVQRVPAITPAVGLVTGTILFSLLEVTITE